MWKCYKIVKKTVQRFNPLHRPVIPVHFTMQCTAAVFTVLYIHDQIVCTFIPGYGELAISAWGLWLLMIFLESVMEIFEESDDEK